MTPKGISKEKGSYVGVHISVPTLDCALDSKKSIKWVSFSWLLSYLQLLTAACFGLSSLSIRGFNPSESTIGFLAHAAPAAAMGRPPSDTSVLSGLTCPVHRAGFFNAKKWPFNQKVTFNYSWRSEIWKSDSFLACESDIACHSEKKWIFNDKGRPNRTDTCHYHNNHGRNDHCGPYFFGGGGDTNLLGSLILYLQQRIPGGKKEADQVAAWYGIFPVVPVQRSTTTSTACAFPEFCQVSTWIWFISGQRRKASPRIQQDSVSIRSYRVSHPSQWPKKIHPGLTSTFTCAQIMTMGATQNAVWYSSWFHCRKQPQQKVLDL